jgi:hypothetical protein
MTTGFLGFPDGETADDKDYDGRPQPSSGEGRHLLSPDCIMLTKSLYPLLYPCSHIHWTSLTNPLHALVASCVLTILSLLPRSYPILYAGDVCAIFDWALLKPAIQRTKSGVLSDANVSLSNLEYILHCDMVGA